MPSCDSGLSPYFSHLNIATTKVAHGKWPNGDVQNCPEQNILANPFGRVLGPQKARRSSRPPGWKPVGFPQGGLWFPERKECRASTKRLSRNDASVIQVIPLPLLLRRAQWCVHFGYIQHFERNTYHARYPKTVRKGNHPRQPQ